MAKKKTESTARAWREDGGQPEIEGGLLVLRAESGDSIYPESGRFFNTGMTVEIPEGCVGLLTGDPELNRARGCHAAAEILQGRADVVIKLYNRGRGFVDIRSGDRIGQLVILPALHFGAEEQAE